MPDPYGFITPDEWSSIFQAVWKLPSNGGIIQGRIWWQDYDGTAHIIDPPTSRTVF